jgi:uncharacterized protein YndB with AHSA1/START domain
VGHIEEVSVDIPAPIETVWGVLMDLETWPAWTPTMKSLARRTHGDLAVGSQVRVSQPFMTPHTWTITELARPTTFTWETHQLGVTLVARHDLTQVDGHTRAIISVDIRGLVGRLIVTLAAARTRNFVRQEANGLSARSTSL